MNNVPQRCVAPLGRLLLSAIFLSSGLHKLTAWSATAKMMTDEGMRYVSLFLIGAVAFEILGGLSVLFGWWARLGALLLIVFLIPTTMIFHDFWKYQDQAQQMQMINFLKNAAILGGLLYVLAYGAGPLSCDAWSARKKSAERRS